MKLPTEIFGDVVVIHTPEEFAEEQAEQVGRYVSLHERASVIVDLDNTEAIDSQGLTALLDAQDELRRRGGDLKVAVTNKVNRTILHITRLDQQIDVFESVIEAVKAFG